MTKDEIRAAFMALADACEATSARLDSERERMKSYWTGERFEISDVSHPMSGTQETGIASLSRSPVIYAADTFPEGAKK